MKKKDNKLSSFLLAVMMIASLFSMVPATAIADDTKTVYVGIITEGRFFCYMMEKAYLCTRILK